MNFGIGDGTLLDVVRGLGRTLPVSAPSVPALDSLDAQILQSHDVTQSISLANVADRSDESLRSSLHRLPGRSSAELLSSQTGPPHPSAYNLLTPQGKTAYKKDRGVTTIVGDKTYRAEPDRQATVARHKNESAFLQNAALKQRLYGQSQSQENAEAFRQADALRKRQYHHAKKDDADYKQKNTLKQMRYHERRRNDEDYKQKRSLRARLHYQKKKASAQLPLEGQLDSELPHLHSSPPTASSPASLSGTNTGKTAAAVCMESLKLKLNSTSGTQDEKGKKVIQPSVANRWDEELQPSALDPSAAHQPSVTLAREAIAQTITHPPETSLAPTSSRPRMSDQEMLELAKHTLLADSP